LPIKLFFIAH